MMEYVHAGISAVIHEAPVKAFSPDVDPYENATEAPFRVSDMGKEDADAQRLP